MVSQGHITYTVGHSVQCTLHCSWTIASGDLTESPGNSNIWLTDVHPGNLTISIHKNVN